MSSPADYRMAARLARRLADAVEQLDGYGVTPEVRADVTAGVDGARDLADVLDEAADECADALTDLALDVAERRMREAHEEREAERVYASAV